MTGGGDHVPARSYYKRGPVMSKGLIIALLLLSSLAFSAEPRYDVPIGDSPSMGPENAPITIIEFIDFQ